MLCKETTGRTPVLVLGAPCSKWTKAFSVLGFMSCVHLYVRAEGPCHFFFKVDYFFFGVNVLFSPQQNIVNIDAFSYEFYIHCEGGQVYYNLSDESVIKCPLLKVVTMHLVTYM